MAIKKQTIIKWMLTTMWIIIGAGTVVLLVAAIRKKDAADCKGVDINIKGVNNTFFVDKKDVLDSIISIENCNPVGQPVSSFDLKAMERKLSDNVWVKSVQLFFDNNEMLQVSVMEREPVARVFTTTGTTFYIDTAISMLPLNEKFSARLPAFTNFPSDKTVLSKADSALLKEIKNVSLVIQQDSFRMALIDQVDITPQRTFEMVPKIGNNIIEFGDASDAAEKFNKLKLFYNKIIPKAGMSYYSVIDVQYKNEIVAKRKGADDVSADSLRTIQIMKIIAANAEKQADDSVQAVIQDNDHSNVSDSSIIQQSVERNDEEGNSENPEKIIPSGIPTLKPIIEKPKPAEQNNGTKKPSVVLPKPNSTDKSKPIKTVVQKPVITKTITKPVNTGAIKKDQSKTDQTDKPKPTVQKPMSAKQDNDY